MADKNYLKYKYDFIEKHCKHGKVDWHCETSPMDENGQYVKQYIFADGACMTEINRPVYETVNVEVEVKGVKIKTQIDVKLLETECWHTDDAKSIKFYERF